MILEKNFMDQRPIGIFDSGLGGLTAAEELSSLMPNEHIVYFGDSFNMPYGEKDHDAIVEMSRADMRFLTDKNVKLVFIACGTATSNALEVLRKECPVPVFGVVDASVNEALEATRNGRVGVLATRASIQAGTFEKLLKQRREDVFVESKACPKFATMVEDGVFEREDPRVRTAAAEYLPCMQSAGVDTVILGCTHYPLLADIISEYLGGGVRLISSSAAAARAVAKYIRENGMTSENGTGSTEYYTSGDRDAFAATAFRMLRRDISSQLRQIEPLTKEL